MLTLNDYVNEIFTTLNEIADRKGCKLTNISKITGHGSDSSIYEIAKVVVTLSSQKSYERFTLSEYARALKVITNVRLKLDGLGHLAK